MLFRRIILCALALALALPAGSSAEGACELTIARLKYGGGGDWYANPSSLPNLVEAVAGRTAIRICDSVPAVEINDARLFRYPFLYMTGHGNVRFSHKERLRLRRFLIGGGFLWADDNYGMDESFRREMKRLFPENPLIPIPNDHPVFASVYRLSGPPKVHEHDGEPAQAFGVFFDDRLAVFYTYSADIGDGMEDAHVHNDSPETHEAALRMGVNVVAWFLAP